MGIFLNTKLFLIPMVKALVTGGAGFIGSHIVDALINLGYDVVVLDDLIGGFKENVNPKARLIMGSIVDSVLIQNLFETEKFDYVFHIAAYTAEGLSHFVRKFNYENNIIGSINLINAAVNNNIKCFVYTSSIAVYGSGQLPMDESMVPMPEDPYGISKLAVEQDLKAAHHVFGLNYIIFRPHNVYGERQNIGDKYRNVVGIFMNKIMQGQPVTIFGDGTQTRAYSYIKDVAPIIARSINEKKAYYQIFNIGSDKPYSIIELVQAVCEAFNVKPQITYLEARKEVLHAYSTHNRLREVFGDYHETPLREGIRQMAAWAKKEGIKSSSIFLYYHIEVKKNMPDSWK